MLLPCELRHWAVVSEDEGQAAEGLKEACRAEQVPSREVEYEVRGPGNPLRDTYHTVSSVSAYDT